MIFRLRRFGSKYQDGRRKNRDGKDLARALVSQRHSGVFRLRKLLQKVHPKLQ